MIRYGLLGPVAAWRDGREADLGSPQQRALFALLLLHRNQTVSTDRMTDVLWPTDVPANAVAVLRTYVNRLRAGPVEPGALLTRPGGYQLRVADGEVDSDRLEALLTAAREELERGGAAAAESSLNQALALVRGPALPELPDYDGAAVERSRLDELRAAVAEELVEARLVQGDHRELVPALRAAVAATPLRERIWGQLMVALYRGGRQAEALEAYREAYRTLAELGLAGRAAAARARTDDPAPGHSPRRSSEPRPRSAALRHEPGRAGTELDAVEDDVRAGRLVSLVGPAGAGKTRLAAETAGRAGPWLGSRVWWVDLGAVGPGRVVAATSRALAAPQLPGRAPVDGIIARLGDSPGLLVLDNCEHVIEEAAALATRLLEEGAYVRILATSREALRLGEERVHRLAGLDAEPAALLFHERAEAPVDDTDGRRGGRRATRRASPRDRARGGQAAFGLGHRARTEPARAAVVTGRRARATRPRASARSRPPSRGATTCSHRPSSTYFGSSPFSRAASTPRPPRRWPARTCSRRLPGSWMPRWLRPTRRATGC